MIKYEQIVIQTDTKNTKIIKNQLYIIQIEGGLLRPYKRFQEREKTVSSLMIMYALLFSKFSIPRPEAMDSCSCRPSAMKKFGVQGVIKQDGGFASALPIPNAC